MLYNNTDIRSIYSTYIIEDYNGSKITSDSELEIYFDLEIVNPVDSAIYEPLNSVPPTIYDRATSSWITNTEGITNIEMIKSMFSFMGIFGVYPGFTACRTINNLYPGVVNKIKRSDMPDLISKISALNPENITSTAEAADYTNVFRFIMDSECSEILNDYFPIVDVFIKNFYIRNISKGVYDPGVYTAESIKHTINDVEVKNSFSLHSCTYQSTSQEDTIVDANVGVTAWVPVYANKISEACIAYGVTNGSNTSPPTGDIFSLVASTWFDRLLAFNTNHSSPAYGGGVPCDEMISLDSNLSDSSTFTYADSYPNFSGYCQIDPTKVADLQAVASDLGITMYDYFNGKDDIKIVSILYSDNRNYQPDSWYRYVVERWIISRKLDSLKDYILTTVDSKTSEKLTDIYFLYSVGPDSNGNMPFDGDGSISVRINKLGTLLVTPPVTIEDNIETRFTLPASSDLGKIQVTDAIYITSAPDNAASHNDFLAYDVETSVDGVSWNMLSSVYSKNGEVILDINNYKTPTEIIAESGVEVDAFKHRYIKIETPSFDYCYKKLNGVSTVTSNRYLVLKALNILNGTTKLDYTLLGDFAEADATLGGTATTYQAIQAAMKSDFSESDIKVNSTGKVTIIVDLGEAKTFDKIRVVTGEKLTGYTHEFKYTISYSNDLSAFSSSVTVDPTKSVSSGIEETTTF